ncbi:MAG: hypothetical protein LBG19_02530 [Prevotellaceae bacterium]|nr:hypothetical protein [Prevotellaceae bacterium]
MRIQLDQYADFGAFAFKTKAESSKENLKRQQHAHDAVVCPEREVRATPSCVHPAEDDISLPANIREGHFIHNRHVCAVLGCEHAPYNKIKDLFSKAGELIIPFPILCKDKTDRIEEIIANDPLLANRNYSTLNIAVKSLYERFQTDQNSLMYGDADNKSGYPITEIMQGIAYVVAEQNELNGVRPQGNYIKLIERHISHNPDLSVEIRQPELLTPLVIIGSNGRGALIGARNPRVYEKLISISSDNDYKLCVRNITEEDLKDGES